MCYLRHWYHIRQRWAFCQIRKIARCACAENARNVFPATSSKRSRHASRYVKHVPWCMPGLQTSGFLWSRWRGKRSRHSRRKRNPQTYVTGKRPMANILWWDALDSITNGSPWMWGSFSAPSHCLDKWRNIVNYTFGNKLHEHLYQHTCIFIADIGHGNAFCYNQIMNFL